MSITKLEAAATFQSQKDFFTSGATLSYAYRKRQIKKLKSAIKARERDILDALDKDLGKPEFEAFISEVGFMYQEISHTLHELRDWMDTVHVPTSIAHFPTQSRVISVPKGQVLILSPWNYPFQLVINPLLAAMAAGNTAMLKLPRQTPATAAVIDSLISETFDTQYICCIDIADEDISATLLKGLRFDHIFFTGSTAVGKLIAKDTAEQLIPLTLELGGKSPAIIDQSANIGVSAKRIIWGKAFNAGQTCVAPDHVLVHHEVKDKLLAALRKEAKEFMQAYEGVDGFTRIINSKRYEALKSLLEGVPQAEHPEMNESALHMGLAIIDEPGLDSKLMQEEIFGPLLPVLSYKNEKELLAILARNPFPLSFYLFSKDNKLEERLISRIPFGGGCINNCLIHLANPEVPFGGVGTSGMGNYHSKA